MNKKKIVIGKIVDNKWNFIYENDSNISICVFGDLKEQDDMVNHLILIREILYYFQNETSEHLVVCIKNLFLIECVNNWIEDWKKDDFYYYKNSNKLERLNRDLLIEISKLKDK